jgi:hypothetical protein
MALDNKIPSILAGVAGEYLVAGELSRRGWIASITLRNTRGVDILASNSELTRSVGIQVKTSQGGSGRRIVREQGETRALKGQWCSGVGPQGSKERRRLLI